MFLKISVEKSRPDSSYAYDEIAGATIEIPDGIESFILQAIASGIIAKGANVIAMVSSIPPHAKDPEPQPGAEAPEAEALL